ncbi:TVP38/TMEM64 family protein [Prochlorococcus marinus]|nr:VTT domain-containing protein [Prochlorococcus marinus]
MRGQSIYKYLLLVILITGLIVGYKTFDTSTVNNLILESYNNIGSVGIVTILLIFSLRFISIIIPILPGTYCSILAGYFFGIEAGLFLVFFADFTSCSCSFFLSRKLGSSFIANFLGARQMQKIEGISKKYIERNFFLMTGFLMTQFFDFVCYAIGLTKISWKRFMPALVVSIIISDIPFVAGGFAIKELKDASVSQVLNGEVSVLQGPYLLVFVVSALIVFTLGFLNLFLKKRV